MGAMVWNKFQFLHGTIKRETATGVLQGAMGFQFLHGTIKRFIILGFISTYSYFNSFMVQLKEKNVK